MGYNQEYRKFTYNRGPITVPGIFDDLIVLCVCELYIHIIASVPRTPHIQIIPTDLNNSTTIGWVYSQHRISKYIQIQQGVFCTSTNLNHHGPCLYTGGVEKKTHSINSASVDGPTFSNQNIIWAGFKSRVTFHWTGWFIEILKMA